MSRRRTRSRASWSTALLAVVVTLLGGALLNAAGWAPVLVATAVGLVLAGLSAGRRRGGRRTRRRHS